MPRFIFLFFIPENLLITKILHPKIYFALPRPLNKGVRGDVFHHWDDHKGRPYYKNINDLVPTVLPCRIHPYTHTRLFIFTLLPNLPILQAGRYKIPEQGMGVYGPRFKLGMELHADKPWVVPEFNGFNQDAVRRNAGQHHARILEL